MTDTALLRQIMDRLKAIESILQQLADPIAYVSVQEKAEIVRKAVESGDKAAVRAAVKQINGR